MRLEKSLGHEPLQNQVYTSYTSHKQWHEKSPHSKKQEWEESKQRLRLPEKTGAQQGKHQILWFCVWHLAFSMPLPGLQLLWQTAVPLLLCLLHTDSLLGQLFLMPTVLLGKHSLLPISWSLHCSLGSPSQP